MALSGTLSTKDIGPEIADNRYYQLDWTATQDIVNNKSTINWTLKMVAGDPAHAGWIAERTLKVVIAGQTVVDKVDRVERMPDGTVFASGTIPLDHNSDGTKSFTASIQAALYYSEVNTTASKTFTLNTIARHTTMSVANGTLGTAQTLTLTRQSTSYKHTIKATCGSYSAYIQGATGTLGSTATKLTATSITFTPPMDLASLNTTGTSLSVTWTVETFNDTTSIGTKSYTKTYAIPASIKPSASLTLSDANGYASDWGGSYIQNKSKFSGNVTAAGSYGSTIKSYSTVVNGKTYTGSSFTTDVISGSGNYTITTTVTDSRGRTASATQTATVIPYTDPTISIKEVYRSNASGVATASGEYLTVKFDATVASMDTSNCAMYEVSYKKPTDTSYITVALGNYDDWFTVTDGTYTFLADASSSYNVVVSVEDSFSTTETFGTGKSKSKLWSLLSGGLGIAIGKVADWAGFEVDMPARFNQETLVYSEPDDCYYDLGNELSNLMSDMSNHTHDEYYDTRSRTANTVLAAPNGSAGGATFRALVAADLPTVTVAKGGTGATTAAAACTNLGIKDYITAQGVTTVSATGLSWCWWKFNSGLAIVYSQSTIRSTQNFPYTPDGTGKWGAVYSGEDLMPGAWPITFVENPVCHAHYVGADPGFGGYCWVAIAGGVTDLTKNAPGINMIRPTNGTIGHPAFRMIAIGRWK